MSNLTVCQITIWHECCYPKLYAHVASPCLRRCMSTLELHFLEQSNFSPQDDANRNWQQWHWPEKTLEENSGNNNAIEIHSVRSTLIWQSKGLQREIQQEILTYWSVKPPGPKQCQETLWNAMVLHIAMTICPESCRKFDLTSKGPCAMHVRGT